MIFTSQAFLIIHELIRQWLTPIWRSLGFSSKIQNVFHLRSNTCILISFAQYILFHFTILIHSNTYIPPIILNFYRKISKRTTTQYLRFIYILGSSWTRWTTRIVKQSSRIWNGNSNSPTNLSFVENGCCPFVLVFFFRVFRNTECRLYTRKYTYNVTLNKNATLHNLALFSTTNHTCNVTKNRNVTMHKLLNACEHTM